MTNTMTYKGYSARIEYDDEDGIFTGRLAGIRDGVGFHADTVDALRTANKAIKAMQKQMPLGEIGQLLDESEEANVYMVRRTDQCI